MRSATAATPAGCTVRFWRDRVRRSLVARRRPASRREPDDRRPLHDRRRPGADRLRRGTAARLRRTRRAARPRRRRADPAAARRGRRCCRCARRAGAAPSCRCRSARTSCGSTARAGTSRNPRPPCLSTQLGTLRADARRVERCDRAADRSRVRLRRGTGRARAALCHAPVGARERRVLRELLRPQRELQPARDRPRARPTRAPP